MNQYLQHVRHTLQSLRRDSKWIAALAVILSIFGAVRFGNILKEERELQARQAIHAEAQALGSVMQAGMETLSRELTLVMDEKLRKGEGAEFDRDILDISLWLKRDLLTKPVRTVLGLNSNYLTPLQDAAIRQRGNDPTEIEKANPAFEGKWVVTPVETTELGPTFLVAVPLNKPSLSGSSSLEIVTAHVRQSYFQRYFRPEAPFQAVLLRSDGKELLSSDGARTGATGGLNDELSRVSSSLSLSSGYLKSEAFDESAGIGGAYRQVVGGQFTIAAWGPTSSMQYSPYSDFRVYLAALFLMLGTWTVAFGARVIESKKRSVEERVERPAEPKPILSSESPEIGLDLAQDPTPDKALNLDLSAIPIETGAQLWWVNNGAQTIGPMDASEIAARLFSQDLDFDCTCWPDGQDEGSKLPLSESGLFNDINAANATRPDHLFWVFIDSQGIVGPCSLEEVLSGKFPEDAYVCNGSTVLGWAPFLEWRRSVEASALSAERNQTNRSIA